MIDNFTTDSLAYVVCVDKYKERYNSKFVEFTEYQEFKDIDFTKNRKLTYMKENLDFYSIS